MSVSGIVDGCASQNQWPICCAASYVQSLRHVQNGNDIQYRERANPLRVIQCHPIGDTRAAVVTDEGELRDTELIHDIHEHPAHGALADSAAIDRFRGKRRVAVAWEIGCDDGEVVGEIWSDVSPRQAGLWITMQQQHDGSTTGPTEEHGPSRNGDGLTRERIEGHT